MHKFHAQNCTDQGCNCQKLAQSVQGSTQTELPVIFCQSNKKSHLQDGSRCTVFWALPCFVEVEGFEPSSNHGPNKLSTCLAFNLIFVK